MRFRLRFPYLFLEESRYWYRVKDDDLLPKSISFRASAMPSHNSEILIYKSYMLSFPCSTSLISQSNWYCLAELDCAYKWDKYSQPSFGCLNLANYMLKSDWCGLPSRVKLFKYLNHLRHDVCFIVSNHLEDSTLDGTNKHSCSHLFAQ